MANFYLKSGAAGAANGSSWTDAFTTMSAAASGMSAGDTLFVSNNHAESSATAQTIAFPGTLASPCRVICVSDAATPPTAVATTAVVSTTGGSSINIRGTFSMYGVSFECGSSSSSAVMTLCGTDQDYQIFKSCKFVINTTNGSGNILAGITSSNFESSCIWYNCDVKFAAAVQGIRPGQNRFRWRGGSMLSGGTSPNSLFALQPDHVDVQADGVDLSNASASIDITNPAASGAGSVVLRNCKLPASWSGSLGTPTGFNTRIEMYNCDSGDTNYKLRISDYAGTVSEDTGVYRDGGASDGITPLSWKMSGSANAEYPAIRLESHELAAWNDTVDGSTVTVSVQVVHDGASALKDNEIWLEVQALTNSGFPLSAFSSDEIAGNSIIDPATSAAAHATSAETWTGDTGTGPNGSATWHQIELSVDVVPREVGFILARVVTAKASTTAYVDPELVLT